MLHVACVGEMANIDVARLELDHFDATLHWDELVASPGLPPASHATLRLLPVMDADRKNTTPPVASVPRRRCLFQDHVRSGGPRSFLYCKE